ncbi:MAG: stalk domain-containing protein [Kyrpidia sp.]|nr:stalk domain-containing protein [Kyrpidia sp.]
MRTGLGRTRHRGCGSRFGLYTGWAAAPLLVLGSWLANPGVSLASWDGPALYVDGKRLTPDVPPYMANDRVMVPVRPLVESLGGTVGWNGSEQTAIVDRGPVHLTIPIGRNVLYRNGAAIPLDAPAVLVRDRTMIPVRAVAEALGEKVVWDPVHWAVSIITPPSPGASQPGTSGPGSDGGQNAGPRDGGSDGPVPPQPSIPTTGSTITETGTSGSPAPTPGAPIDVQSAEPAVSAAQVNRVRALLADAGIYDRLRLDIPGDWLRPVYVHLVATRDGFSQALSAAGLSPSQVETFSSATSGAAFGNDIYLPLYVVADDAQIANVLAHELTHVYLDQNGLGDQIPVWFNEGLAWHEGMAAQARFQPRVVWEGWRQRIESAMVDSRRKGLLGPLSAITEDLILNAPKYNPEWQGYVALERLTRGRWEAVRSYLTEVKNGRPESEAFLRVFGLSQSALNDQVNRWLDSRAGLRDSGVTLVLEVRPGFSGNIGVLPRGTDTWSKTRVTPGTYRVTVAPDGTIGGLNGAKVFYTSAGADPNTMFIGIQPDSTGPSTQGQEGGFAISYAYGQYFYQNAWSRTIGDVPTFSQADAVLGVRLVDVQTGLTAGGS